MHVCLSAKTLILILSLCLGILAFWAPNVEAASAAQDSLFQMLPIYLKSIASVIPGYYSVSITPPSGSTIHSITLNSSGMFSQWISNAYSFPGGNITIDRSYNFLFSMYANSTAFEAGKMFGQFCIYRGGSEIFLFNTTESEYVRNQTASRHIWYYRIDQSFTFLSGDRLVFKLFLNVLAPGSFTFYYDSRFHTSYLTDPTETRYLRKTTQTVNGLTAQKLTTTFGDGTYGAQSISPSGTGASCQWGVKIFRRLSDGTEIDLTNSTYSAIVYRNATGGVSGQSNTWSCPATNLISTDSIVVKYYGCFIGESWQLRITSTTTQLDSQYLNSSTWTFYYYTYLKTTVVKIAKLYYDGLDDSLDYYPTRISNFVYTSADHIAPYYYNPNAIETTLQSSANYAYCNFTEIGATKSQIDYGRFGNNNTGSFTWQTWQWAGIGLQTKNFTSVSFYNNNTVGNVIAYMWQCNDTSGNLNDTMPYQYYTITSSISWQNPIVWGCWFYRNWSTAIVWNNWFYRNWSSAISWESYFYRNWSLSINWENWFFRNWSSAIYWTDDYLNLTIEIVPGWQPPIVWKFRIGVNPNELAQAGVIALIFFPILLLVLGLLLRRKK